MDVGEVRVADDGDFERLKNLTDEHDGWKVEYEKRDTKVWTKSTEQTQFKMIKLHTVYEDVSPSLLFDVLMDPLYRKKWDVHMLDSYDIGCPKPQQRLRSPPPLRNRDFVLQRSWLETGKEILIINHSVFHQSVPPKKGFIRATSYLTGIVVRPSGRSGCSLSYVTQCDPKGALPAWFVNKLTKIFAPKMVKKLHKACLGYTAWKASHQPGLKPWLHPDQVILPKLDVSSCVSVGQQEHCG
ncbi:hypothetical protein HPB47_024629 [Ixodes persulcatus]|uniref:Uncharacterized protein n=1 Tax=Ixodes persulcatus TaxID=34615 RepID=A0AC60Q4B7_IXOPE|nr:hypothetical protein HPB47_024629 [Ixodes persulcatus]